MPRQDPTPEPVPEPDPVPDPVAEPARRDAAWTLLRRACLDLDRDQRAEPERARALLTADPSLAAASLATAAATGDLRSARRLLAEDPDAVHRADGPFGWPPLMHLTYSRLQGTLHATGDLPERPADPLGTAQALLDAGADPNAGVVHDGLPSPYTALTGVFGGGEQAEAPHAQELDLARALLSAGADPNDSQTVYNRGLGDARGPREDTEMLALLLEAGLGRGDGGPWHRRLAPHHPAPAQLLAEALQHAAHHDLAGRARLLLEAGADPDRPGTHPLHGGRSPYEEAVLHGAEHVAALLEAHGADTSGPDEVDRLVGALLRAGKVGSEEELAALRARRANASGRCPEDVVARAAALGRPSAIRRCLAIGARIDARTPEGLTALHEAAVRGHTECVSVLLERGADPALTEPVHGANAAGWAAHAGYAELAARLTRAEGRAGAE